MPVSNVVISVSNARSLSPSQGVALPGVSDFVWLADDQGVALISETGVLLLPVDQQGTSASSGTSQLPLQFRSETPSLFVAAKEAAVIAWVSEGIKVNSADVTDVPPKTTTIESVSPVTSLALNSSGQRLAYATFSREVTTLNLGDASDKQIWHTPDWLADLAYSPDGSQLAGVDPANFTVYFMDASSGEILKTLSWQGSVTPSLTSADLSPDWSQIAWVTQGAVQLMKVGDGNLGPLLSHQYVVSDIAWSPDSRLLATASAVLVNDVLQPAAMIWDAKSGNLLNSLIQPAPVQSIAFSPDGGVLAVLNANGNLQTWSVGR
jgi:WD40 repeat protein